MGKSPDKLFKEFEGTNIDEDIAIIADTRKQETQNNIFLEEYRFSTKPVLLDKIIALIQPFMNAVTKNTLEKQLVIVNDDNFTHLANHATPVNAHISIESETKIVKPGALWYEETLPPETVLYIGLNAVKSRDSLDKDSPHSALNAKNIMGAVIALFNEKPWLQVGGNETIGMGWCAVTIPDSLGEKSCN
jgi:CRISPR-associated protein Cmr4